MTSQTPHFTKLISNLQQQIKLSKLFVTILDQEQKALVDMSIESLMTLSKQKENGVRQMTYVDEQIKEASRAILTVAEEKPVTLEQVCTVLPYDEAKKIDIGASLLKKIRKQIKEKNYVNFRFTHDTLQYLSDAISLISNGIATDPIYSIHGLGRAASVAPNLISREV